MKLNGKVALVTGGAVRIGRAICEALAREGCDVVIHCRRSTREAGRLAKHLRRQGVRALVASADLRLESAGRALIRKAVQWGGRLDILVNNAAVFHKDSLRTLTGGKVQEEFAVNLFAPLWLTRAFADVVRRGAVINLLDRRITGLDTACLPYLLAKKALAEATRIMALALAPAVRVNGVAPGAVLPPSGKGREYLQDKAGPVPLRRQVAPCDVAEAVIFLLKNDALTGQILFVDGGQHLI